MIRSLALFALTLLIAASAAAQAPRLIPYQGVLLEDGAPVTASTQVEFALFDAATGGDEEWSETQTVDPDDDGRFAVLLGSVVDLRPNFGNPLWLEVTVAGTALGPRTMLGAAPYALGLYGITVTPPSGLSVAPSIVAGDPANVAGQESVVSGGKSNSAIGSNSTIGGGEGNTAGSSHSTVGGGEGNTASDRNSTVGGGEGNTASSRHATVGGGQNNTASEFNATVGGGIGNTASQRQATVSGGESNTASERHATVGGGSGNTASERYATVGGGRNNEAGGDATVGGGSGNTASGGNATVGGGNGNTASGGNATVPGGTGNVASGANGFAAGRSARAVHSGAFVWSSGSSLGLESTAEEQFLISADGGVGIGTNAPTALLDINVSLTSDQEVAIRATSEGTGSVASFTSNRSNDSATLEVTQSPFGDGDIAQFFEDDDLRVRIARDGNVTADGAFTGGGADFAEYFALEAGARVTAGDVVGLRGGIVSLRTDGADQVMVISSDPAFVGNPALEDDGALVALVGQVEVALEGGARPGDLLVASGRGDGSARAVSPSRYRVEDGAVIGRVLEAEAGRALALVGVDEASALRDVVARQARALDRQAETIGDLEARIARLEALLAPTP